MANWWLQAGVGKLVVAWQAGGCKLSTGDGVASWWLQAVGCMLVAASWWWHDKLVAASWWLQAGGGTGSWWWMSATLNDLTLSSIFFF